jgi:hypothetical protein
MTRDFVAEATAAPIPDIGQIDHASKLKIMREVRAGRLAKWRGRWFPEAGAPRGIGPLKTCYGTPEWAAYYASFKQDDPQ